MKAKIVRPTFKGLAIFLCISCISYAGHAQLQSPKKIVCQNQEVTYTFAAAYNCTITWTVTGGVFPDNNNSTTLTTYTDATKTNSTAKVKWSVDGSGPNLSVNSSCTGGASFSDSEDVEIDEIPLELNASSNSISQGTTITLTASSWAYTNTYSWISTTGGGLASTSGNPVNATPNYTSVTYTVTATHQFLHNPGPNQTTNTCTQKASTVVVVAIPPISGNSICCGQCLLVGTTPNLLTQTAGTNVSGGNGVTPLVYQWQKSTNGTSFSNVTGDPSSYQPGALTAKTWYRRCISGGGVATSCSNEIIMDVVDVPSSPTYTAGTYFLDTRKKAYGTITIQGNQTALMNVEVEFIATLKIQVIPETRLKPGIVLRIGDLCESTPGGREGFYLDLDSALNGEVVDKENLQAETVYQEIAFTISPNPAKDEVDFFYTGSSSIVEIEIIDATGNIVGSINDSKLINRGHLRLNCSELINGIYICRLTTNRNSAIRRLVVKH